MDLEKIKSILNRTEGVSAWFLRHQLTDALTVIRLPWLVTVRNGKFVRQPNPHPREVIHAPGEEIWVNVYSRFEQNGSPCLGETVGQIISDDESTVRQTIGAFVAAARSQPNRPFSLPDPTLAYPEVLLADPLIAQASRSELLTRAQTFNDTVLAAAEREPEIEVSNLEIFLRRQHVKFETGTGVKLEFDATRADAEICFLARVGDRVGEHTARPTVRRLTDLDPSRVVATNADLARGVTTAGPPPAYSGPVVLTGEAAHHFLLLSNGPFLFHCNARYVHEKTSRYRPGAPVTGDAPVKGDHVTLASDPSLPFGSGSSIFSPTDGSPSRKIILINNGDYAELQGHRRYFDYLGLIEQGIQPSGLVGNTLVSPGRWSSPELLDSNRIVLIKTFSDFQTDVVSGDFASEIRLGELRENGKATPFKGGLLIGNYFQALADARYSSELLRQNDYHGPAMVRLGDLQVAG